MVKFVESEMSKVLQSATQKSTTAKTAVAKMLMMPSNNNKQLTTKAAANSIGQQQRRLPDRAVSDAAADGSASIDFDDFTSSSSILEFLSKEQECWKDEDADAESIFQEVSRLADNSDTRSVDEILREAELLIQQQQTLVGNEVSGLKKQNAVKMLNGGSFEKSTLAKSTIKMNSKYTKKIENVRNAVSAKKKPRSSTPSPPPKRADSVADVSVAASVEISSVSRSISQQSFPTLTPPSSAASTATGGGHFSAFVDNLPSESVLSEESTPKDLQTLTTGTEKHFQNGAVNGDDDTDDGTDTMEEITEGIETIELVVNEEGSNSYCMAAMTTSANSFDANSFNQNETARVPHMKFGLMNGVANRQYHQQQQSLHCESSSPLQCLTSPVRRLALNFNATQACSPLPLEEFQQQQKQQQQQRRNSRRSSMQTPDSGIDSHATVATQTARAENAPNNDAAFAEAATATKFFINKSSNSSPKHFVSSVTSPIESFAAITREHALKHEIELLQEKLKDTEERLQSLQIRHDSLSQLHRDLRESNTHLQEETEMLKLDVQHLNECANILRTELKASRQDRTEALDLQKVLQTELDECRQEKKHALQQKEKDTKTIQDLHRQCREMERILMRKHPDSVSALIVASKNPGKMTNNEQENVNSRKLLEQRIAQLESDAKEQDKKAQQILANVQARFNSVQSKYETHIADLETQVLSLQEINTKLNEKIESQVRTLDYFVTKKAEKFYNNCTQTDPTHDELQLATIASNRLSHAANANANSSMATQTAKASTRDHCTNTIASNNSHPPSAGSSTSSTANSTPNNSRPNSKQSGLRKPTASANSLSSALASKLPVSQSDSTISLTSYHHSVTNVKEDAHLLATIRGMRVDLAIKDKAMQRLSRELDDCKKTIKKLQKDASKPYNATNSATTSRRTYDAAHYSAASDHQSSSTMPANTENQALKEAQSKIKLLEADYKSLHDKRLQDLKTLQSAHERELSSCHETVRILQQRLNERDEAFAMHKRRKVPVDYYALKAKVSSLERRHSEREERLHMLVEALSKGRLNGALDDLLGNKE